MGIEPRPQRSIRAKINDVAELAGVSIKTVSRVLNNEPNVRPATREKVISAVKELSYVPDFSARSLAGQRSYMIALFYDTISAAYLGAFQAGALDACRAFNYHLMVERGENDSEQAGQGIAGIAMQTRLDGVILLPPLSDNASVISALANAGVAHVLIAPETVSLHGLSVGMDDAQAAYEATSHLIGLGHRRIGHIKGHPAHGKSHVRYDGYCRAMEDAGLSVDKAWVADGFFTVASGSAAARAILAQTPRPTAIFSANDDMAAGVAIAATEMNLKVPGDLSIFGFDDSQIAEVASPPLTTIRQPIYEMARGAVDMLISASRKQPEGHEPSLSETYRQYPFEIVMRQSVDAVEVMKT